MPTLPPEPPIPQLQNFRDTVRVYLEIIPPAATGGSAGAAPTGQPNPDNFTLNLAINAAIDTLNRVAVSGPVIDLGAGIQVKAAPAWYRGAQWVDYSSLLALPLVPVQVLNAVWVSSGNNGATTRLEPYNWYMDETGNPTKHRQFPQHNQQPQPQSYILSGFELGLIPPCNQAGTLYLTVMQGLNQLVADTDAIVTLPFCYQSLIAYIAVLYICARTLRDIDMTERAQQFYPIVSEGLTSFFEWRGGGDRSGLDRVLDAFRRMTGLKPGSTSPAMAPSSLTGAS